MLKKGKAYYFLISFLFLSIIAISQTDQRKADSLALIYEMGNLDDTTKLELLRNMAFNEVSDYKKGIAYAEELIRLSEKLGNGIYLHRGYLQKGHKNKELGNMEQALAAYFKSAEAARNVNYVKGEATAYTAIADAYSRLNNHDNAMRYYHQAISTFRTLGDPKFLASALSNAGDEFRIQGSYDSALHYFREAGSLFKKINDSSSMAFVVGNIGMTYAIEGNNITAEKNLNDAITMLEGIGDYAPICDYLISMSDIYSGKGDLDKAITYAEKSLNIAFQRGFKDLISKANLKLSDLFVKKGDPDLALKYYKDHIIYRDSVKNLETVQKAGDLRYNYEMKKKQVVLDLVNQQKKNAQLIVIGTVVALILLLLLLLGVFQRYKFMRESNKIIEAEKKRSDSLLLNILPEETAQELKQSGKVKAKKFESVTVLFTDFQGFTQYATSLAPEILVNTVDFYFSKFDEIVEKYGLEKIKTVGDSYMCAGGLPFPSADHAYKMVLAAMEIERFISETQHDPTNELIRLDIRIGINTGPVVAGVVGTKKFAYDIWGDTVNIASRMESNSLPGKINISENTYQLVKHQVDVEYRGELHVKNRGIMKMYFVNGLAKSHDKVEISEESKTIT